MLEESWRITLCGGLSARQGARVVTRFRTQKTGLLLAYLALYGERAHGREELAELFWPDSERPLHSLRLALASLRQQLEPPGVEQGQVLAADRHQVRLAAGTVRTDVGEFRAAVAAGRVAELGERGRLLREGLEMIAGELLPGSYVEWALEARAVFAEQVQSALREVVGVAMAQGEWEQGLPYALRWVHADPLNEEAHLAVMRLLLRLKRPGDVVQQFQQLRTLLWEALGDVPGAEARELAAEAGGAAEAVLQRGVETASRAAAGGVADALPGRAAGGMRPLVRLPLPLTSFWGRQSELMRLQALLGAEAGEEAEGSTAGPTTSWRPRVVTLIGVGGAGKTRLAIEAARLCAGQGERAVCFVTLADAATAEQMVQAIAEAVCPDMAGGSAGVEVILTVLEGRSALLVLDNLEQMVEAGAEVVQELLQRLPELVVLVTSRVRLNLDGERELALTPLPVPEAIDTPERLLEFASVQLFVDRAQAACVDFQLTARNAGSVAALCRRLEGLPLAIELGASWAQTLSPAQMLARLDRRFELLRARRKGAAPRHQALAACIEWSFRLLQPEVQAFFCCLCLLRGEWTLETAEMITADARALERVQRLREASFLQAREVQEREGTTLRFAMLESLREFGLEQLGLQEAEKGYERLTAALIAPAHADHLAALDRENVRAAAQWCRATAAGRSRELELLNALMVFWCNRGGWIEGRGWLQEALRRHAGEETIASRRAWNTLGFLHAMLREEPEAQGCFEEALRAAERAGDDATAVRALNNLAITAARAGDRVRACTLAEQSLQVGERLGDERLTLTLINNAGSAHLELGRHVQARALFERSLQQSQALNLPGSTAMCLANLAEVARSLGDGLTARRMYGESLEIFREIGEQPRVAEVLGLLARVLEEQGETEQARRLAEESARLRQGLQGEEETRAGSA